MQSGMPAYAQNALFNSGGGGGGFTNTPVGQGIGQVLNSYFTNPSRPYEKAEGAYDPMFNKSVEAQNPFYNAGKSAIPQFQNWTNSMSNPTDFINHIMSQYQQSPWAKFQTEQGKRGLTNYGSANGLSGSTPLSQFQEQYAHDIGSQDMSQWLEHVLGINTQYGAGLQDQFHTGANAATNLSNIYGQGASDKANLAYNKEAGEQQNTGNMVSGLLKMFLG